MKHIKLFENFEKFDISNYVKLEPMINWKKESGISRREIELNIFHSDTFGKLEIGDILVSDDGSHIVKLTDPSNFRASPLTKNGTFSDSSFFQYGLVDYRRLVLKKEYEKVKGRIKGKQFGF